MLEKEKLLVTSNFSFSHSVFFKVVYCRLFVPKISDTSIDSLYQNSHDTPMDSLFRNVVTTL